VVGVQDGLEAHMALYLAACKTALAAPRFLMFAGRVIPPGLPPEIGSR
jgi:hypothetical protein